MELVDGVEKTINMMFDVITFIFVSVSLSKAAFLAGPWDWKIVSSFNQVSINVSQSLICFRSDGPMAKIRSDLAFRSAASHARTLRWLLLIQV